VNSIGESTLTGKTGSYSGILSQIADEMGDQIDFIEGVSSMSDSELLDLGFNYLSNDSDLMLFPLWLHKFIPDNTELRDTDGRVFIVGEDELIIWADNWVNVGIILE